MKNQARILLYQSKNLLFQLIKYFGNKNYKKRGLYIHTVRGFLPSLVQKMKLIGNNKTSSRDFYFGIFPSAFLLLTVIVYFSYCKIALSKTVYKEYVIALLLPNDYVTEAQNLKYKISKKLPYQDLTNHFHITLYQGAFLEDKVQRIFQELSVQNFIPPRISMDSQIKYQDKKYINWNVKKNDELKNIHSKVLEIAAPYHQGILKRLVSDYKKFDAKNQKQISKYGMNGVLDDYNPHVTLIYLAHENPVVEDVIKDITPITITNEVVADNLVIGEIGYDGNLTNIINKIQLK